MLTDCHPQADESEGGELYANYGKTPSPETKKISEIIKEAVEETEE
jgi:hypothetical protein